MKNNKGKRLICIALGLIAAAMCFACGQGGNVNNGTGNNTGDEQTKPNITTVEWDAQTTGKIISRPQVNTTATKELLTDLNFSKGFAVTLFHANSSNGQKAGQLTYDDEKADGNPVWTMAQWGCTHDMIKDGEYTRNGSVLSYNDGGKKLVVDAAKTGRLTMGITGSEEYARDEDGEVRERTEIVENWPHILVEQGIGYDISESAARLYMEIEYEITKCESLVDRTKYPINPDLNAAQFQWFITLSDANPDSASYKQSMWFGFSMFDTRSLGGTPAGISAYDGGKEDSTGLFIYMPSLSQTTSVQTCKVDLPSSVTNKRLTAKVDILPFIKQGLKIAKQYGAMTGADAKRLRIGSTNVGWEIPGNYDVEAEIYYLNMYEEL